MNIFVISGEQRWDNAGAGNNTQWNTDTAGVFPSIILKGGEKRKAKGSKMKQREAKKKKREENGSKGKQKLSKRSIRKRWGETGSEGKKSRIRETLNLSTNADSITIANREKKLDGRIYLILFIFFAGGPTFFLWRLKHTETGINGHKQTKTNIIGKRLVVVVGRGGWGLGIGRKYKI